MEDCLNDAIKNLIISAHARNVRNEKWAEQSRRREEQLRLVREEQKRIEQLEGMFAQWDKSQQMKRFLEAFEQHHGEGIREREEMQRWLVWARNYAESINPLVSKSKEFQLETT